MYKFLSLLKHETIHSKINKLFGIKRSKIRVCYTESNNFIFLHGECEPIQKPNPLFLFLLDLFQFIYDIIYDIVYLELNYIPEDVLDYIKFIIVSVEKNTNGRWK